jgi:hypothetical protein
MNQPRTKRQLLPELLTHLLMGACLGLVCAIVLFVGDLGELREFFAGEPSPPLAELSFALGLAFMCAVGATLTGYIFIVSEGQ